MQITSCHLSASHPRARKPSIIRIYTLSPTLAMRSHQQTPLYYLPINIQEPAVSGRDKHWLHMQFSLQ